MVYKSNNGEEIGNLNLEIEKKYTVTFEVIEGTFDIEYNIKEIK